MHLQGNCSYLLMKFQVFKNQQIKPKKDLCEELTLNGPKKTGISHASFHVLMLYLGNQQNHVHNVTFRTRRHGVHFHLVEIALP